MVSLSQSMTGFSSFSAHSSSSTVSPHLPNFSSSLCKSMGDSKCLPRTWAVSAVSLGCEIDCRGRVGPGKFMKMILSYCEGVTALSTGTDTNTQRKKISNKETSETSFLLLSVGWDGVDLSGVWIQSHRQAKISLPVCELLHRLTRFGLPSVSPGRAVVMPSASEAAWLARSATQSSFIKSLVNIGQKPGLDATHCAKVYPVKWVGSLKKRNRDVSMQKAHFGS